MSQLNVRFTVTGLCAIVADDWCIGECAVNVGAVEILCLDPLRSQAQALAKPEDPVCSHQPQLIYPEIENGIHYVAKMEGFSVRSELQGMIDPRDEKRVLGLLSLKGKTVRLVWLDLEGNPLPVGGGVIKACTFDEVLRISDYLPADIAATPVEERWKLREALSSLVQARIGLDTGRLSAPAGLGRGDIAIGDALTKSEITFAQNVFWDIPVDSEKVGFLTIVAEIPGYRREELTFQLSSPGNEPKFAIVNICGTEVPEPKMGTEVAAYFDLTDAATAVPLQKRPILRAPLDRRPVRSGSDYCTPNASSFRTTRPAGG